MRTRPFIISWPAPGRLAIMPLPSGGEWLANDLAALRDTGVDTLVNALPEEDRQRLDLMHEPAAAERAGLHYIPFPIRDFGVPDPDDLADLAVRLAAEVNDGRFVVAHCFGGIGRSGLIAGAVLIELGATAQQAMDVVSAARGMPAPETDEQRKLLGSLQTSRARRQAA